MQSPNAPQHAEHLRGAHDNPNPKVNPFTIWQTEMNAECLAEAIDLT